jgi:hypothetical protein
VTLIIKEKFPFFKWKFLVLGGDLKDLRLYILDSDYELSRDELLLMMEELIEIKFTHWNVPMVT